jgi:4-aminobutyrate aminotransferase-like enzyme
LAVLDVIEREHLVENSRAVGEYLKNSLEELAESDQRIREVRGTGLLVGLEFNLDRHETRQLIELVREAGVVVGAAGRNGNVLKLRPPLVARPEHVDRLMGALEASLNGL